MHEELGLSGILSHSCGGIFSVHFLLLLLPLLFSLWPWSCQCSRELSWPFFQIPCTSNWPRLCNPILTSLPEKAAISQWKVWFPELPPGKVLLLIQLWANSRVYEFQERWWRAVTNACPGRWIKCWLPRESSGAVAAPRMGLLYLQRMTALVLSHLVGEAFEITSVFGGLHFQSTGSCHHSATERL